VHGHLACLETYKKADAQETYKKLQKNYFSQRTETMTTNNIKIKIERVVKKGCPQGSCLGPGMWNIFYNTLLNLKFKSGTKIIAIADDVVLLTRGKSVSELENTANAELTKITKWAKENNFSFKDKK
jgi:hypothetical protein